MKKFLILMAFVLLFCILTLILFSYLGELTLGLILSAILFCLPMTFWTIARLTEGSGKAKAPAPTGEPSEPSRSRKSRVIEEENYTPSESQKPETKPETPSRDVEKVSAELYKLRRVAETLEEERREGVLSDEAYKELKKQNDEAIQRLERVNAKASGEFEEKKVYCKKGDHYIDVRDCIESKVPGYVICQEHNEEIRVE